MEYVIYHAHEYSGNQNRFIPKFYKKLSPYFRSSSHNLIFTKLSFRSDQKSVSAKVPLEGIDGLREEDLNGVSVFSSSSIGYVEDFNSSAVETLEC